MTEKKAKLSRRHFLLTVGAGGAATAAAAIVATNTTPSSTNGDKDKRATRGYHASEHVTNYYRTTKV